MLNKTKQFVQQKYQTAKSTALEIAKNEARDLKSLRVKLTYLTFMTWVAALYIISNMIDKILAATSPDKLVTIAVPLLEKAIAIFSIITTVLLVFVIAYLLGKQRFSLKIWGIELNIDSNNPNLNSNLGSNKDSGFSDMISSPSSTLTVDNNVDPRTGEPIK
jgi:hypothetical protein